MESFEYKVKLFEWNLNSILKPSMFSDFFNKSYCDKDNWHEVVMEISPYLTYKTETGEKVYEVYYHFYYQFTDKYNLNSAGFSRFKKVYTEKNFQATEDFTKIFNHWKKLKTITDKDLYLKEYGILIRKMELDRDFE